MTAIVQGRVPDDIERCVVLWVQALRHRDGDLDSRPVAERTRKVFSNPIIRFALSGEPLDGFAVTVPKPDDETTAVLERIAVRPAAAGQGIGRALLMDAVESSTSSGFSRIELAVRRGNSAVRLYEAVGFRAASGPVPHPLGGEPMITYRREV